MFQVINRLLYWIPFMWFWLTFPLYKDSSLLTEEWLTICRERMNILFPSTFKMTNKGMKKWGSGEAGEIGGGAWGGDFQLLS